MNATRSSLKYLALRSGALLLSAIAMPTSAEAAELRCDNCTEATYAQRAKNANIGTHYVYDLYKGQVRKFFVEREPGSNTGTWIYTANPETVEFDVKYVVTELSSYYWSTNRTMRKAFELTPDGPIGGFVAFDGARPGGGRTTIINWLGGNQTLQNQLPLAGIAVNSLIAAAINIFKQVPIQTLVSITFSDGSKIISNFNAADRTFTVIQALDAEGNPIPATLDEATTIDYRFNGNSRAAASMAYWLSSRLGAQIIGTGTVGMACTKSAAGVNCVPY